MIKTIKTKATYYTRQSAKYIDDHRRVIERLLIFTVVCLILLDIYWAACTEIGTISSVIRAYAIGKGIWFTWVWGILFSHLFMTRNIVKYPIKESLAILVLLLLTIGFAVLGHFLNGVQFDGLVIQITLLLMGAAAGFFLWPQPFESTIK